MKYLLKATCLAMLWLLLHNEAMSQGGPTFDKMVDFLPAAPNAAAIVKYGEASLNKNTGVPNINIPLGVVKGNKLAASISLGYSSAGIKVDEIASRVGMGWAINAGGVITRTMRGLPDELNTRLYPNTTIGPNWPTFYYARRIVNSQSTPFASGGYDSEPDLFNYSFDGYSGSFVYNYQGKAVQVNKNGVKIEKDFSVNAPWNFKITTPAGISYLFGGAGAVEKTKRLQSCTRNYDNYLPTSWYLKEIHHYDGEIIYFNYAAHNYEYDNGVTQMMYDPGFSGLGSGCFCPPKATTTCVNITKTEGVLLSSIVSPGKSKVTFQYITRADTEDKLVSAVVFSDPTNTVSSFDLTYNTVTSNATYTNMAYQNNQEGKTPYLVTLSENSADNSLHKVHYFSYNDPANRPSRLSFSQDHWGYFNGKENSSFIPDLGDQYHHGFPGATANREVDFAYAQKGLLEKIVYPTGGITRLFYEPNKVEQGVAYGTLAPHNITCDVTGTAPYGEVNKSKNFHVEVANTGKLRLDIINNPGTFDSIHHWGRVQVKEVPGGAIVFETSYPQLANVYLTPGDYELKLTARGAVITTMATLIFQPDYNGNTVADNLVGGMRVQRLVSANPNAEPMIKKYYYGPLDDLNTSSLMTSPLPRYDGFMVNEAPCPEAGGFLCEYTTLTSASVFNMGLYNNNITSYESVVESIGENFEGGATETQFYVTPDALPATVLNRDIHSAPYSNTSSHLNARLKSETVVKKMANGDLKPIKKSISEYNDPQYAQEEKVSGFTVVLRATDIQSPYDSTCYNAACLEILEGAVGSYDIARYDFFSSWMHPVKQTEILYDENGNNPVTTITNTQYTDNRHYEVTSTDVTNSKGQKILTSYKYPHDYEGTAVYDQMISNNIISPVINSTTSIVNTPGPNTPLAEQQVNYTSVFPDYNPWPASVQKAVKGSALETEGTIDLYDSYGNIFQFTNKAGITTAVIWGYNYLYPVAQVVGSTYANAVAQLTAGSATALQSMDGATLRTELNKIRTNLPSATVTSYTFKHPAGVSSVTDANNKTNTYEYDSFNRLMLVKDQDGNVVQKNEYVYAVPDPNANITVYYNQAQSQNFTRNNCQDDFSSGPVMYTIPAGKYYSLVSQVDANAQASTDMALNGQEYVNRRSACYNTNCGNCIPANCTGVDKKCVNGICETGVRVNTASVKNRTTGIWTCIYHYRWSDSSVSQDYSETSEESCMVNEL